MLKDHIEEAQKLAKEVVSNIINEHDEIGETSTTLVVADFEIKEDEYDEFIEMIIEEFDELDYLDEEVHHLNDDSWVKKYTHIAINGMQVEVDDDADEDGDPYFFITIEYTPVYRYLSGDDCDACIINEKAYEMALTTGESPEFIDDDDD